MRTAQNLDVRIHRIFLSPGHNFFGHHGHPPGEHRIQETSSAECIAGRGLRGDRFFDHRENYKGQITFFASETFQSLQKHLRRPDACPSSLRRNVLTSGIDLCELIDETFEIQGVTFAGVEECRPCHWMDQAVGPGAENFLKGRGGLRARILTSGILSVDAH